ncbi:MAG: zinc metalloprotease HtpX [Desulfovibrio sp.]|nr:zinc metalloprotease HtpX [Desulfovibrio sp.]
MTSQLKTILLLGLLSGLIILLGGMLGGRAGVIFAFAVAVIMNIGSYWYSDKIVLNMYRARELAPSDAPFLHDTVRDLATRAGIPTPRIYSVPEQAPNAFATGRDPEHSAVAVTDGLLNLLSPEELRGVVAHEIGHIVNRDILIQTIAGVMASALISLANMAQFGALFGHRDNNGPGPIGGIILALLAPVAAALIQMAISRSREFLADETGAKLCGQPLALSGALYKLSVASGRTPLTRGNPSTAEMFVVTPLFARDGKIASLFSSHPPIEERMARLQNMAIN